MPENGKIHQVFAKKRCVIISQGVKMSFMNTRQDNKLNMGITVQTTCNRYPAVIAKIPAFVTALGDLGVKLEYIKAQAQIQAGKTDGVTQDKNTAKQALCDKAFEVGSSVGSYASTVKNGELAAKVNFTHSDLLRSRDIETAGLCQNIRTAATDNLAALSDYGVTAADLTDLAQKIANYETALSTPANARVSKKTATDNLDAGFTDLDSILASRMDALLPKFQALSADFVKDYWNARNIVDTAASHTSPAPAPTPTAVPAK